MNSEYWKKYLQHREEAEEAAEEVVEEVVEEVEVQEEVEAEPVAQVAPAPDKTEHHSLDLPLCKCGQMRNNGQEVCNEHGQWVKFH